jgi:hypothetical protein
LRHHQTVVPADAPDEAPFSIDLLTRGSTRIIFTSDAPDLMVSGRNVCSVPRLDVATGHMGEARRTAMAHVKSAIDTGVSSAL